MFTLNITLFNRIQTISNSISSSISNLFKKNILNNQFKLLRLGRLTMLFCFLSISGTNNVYADEFFPKAKNEKFSIGFNVGYSRPVINHTEIKSPLYKKKALKDHNIFNMSLGGNKSFGGCLEYNLYPAITAQLAFDYIAPYNIRYDLSREPLKGKKEEIKKIDSQPDSNISFSILSLNLLYQMKPISNKLIPYFTIGTGMARSKIAESKLHKYRPFAKLPTLVPAFQIDENTSYSPAFLAGIGFIIPVNDRLCFTVDPKLIYIKTIDMRYHFSHKYTEEWKKGKKKTHLLIGKIGIGLKVSF